MKKSQKFIIVSVFLAMTTAGLGVNYARGLDIIHPAYAGATTFNTDTGLTDVSYISSIPGQNALLISGGITNLDRATVEKTGDTNDEDSAIYGTNAAILVYNDATINIKNSSIATSSNQANALF
ncbi:hypothetical protein IKF76_01525, partial [Candidatus Saccharibacteria bacterium]|nr:hypothetical protein [Candidatus Saccharibacteria bacterium]